MSEKTKIQWCDSTINFWEGCTKVSAGCANCYAEARDKRFTGGKLWGKGAPRRKSKSAVKDALAFNRKPWVCECGNALSHKEASAVGMVCAKDCHGGNPVPFHRRRIFSLSLGDWLDPEVPIEWLAEMLDTIRQCDQVTWILCTKRPELWEVSMTLAIGSALRREAHGKEFNDWLSAWTRGNAPNNVCALASIEGPDQTPRIDDLLSIPARWRGVSMEPLLGSVDLTPWLQAPSGKTGGFNPGGMRVVGADLGYPKLDWIIIGGESGPDSRPCNVEWIRSLVAQGKAAGVETFVKQLGANAQTANCTCGRSRDVNCPHCAGKMTLKHPKGGDPAEWPEDLRVQEWPKGM